MSDLIEDIFLGVIPRHVNIGIVAALILDLIVDLVFVIVLVEVEFLYISTYKNKKPSVYTLPLFQTLIRTIIHDPIIKESIHHIPVTRVDVIARLLDPSGRIWSQDEFSLVLGLLKKHVVMSQNYSPQSHVHHPLLLVPVHLFRN